MVDRSTIQRDAQLSYKLAPQGNDWLNADAKIYWSEVRINAQNTGSSGEYREQITKGAGWRTVPLYLPTVSLLTY